jgi:RNA polymerase sigma-70 factor (ECF subfamily)
LNQREAANAELDFARLVQDHKAMVYSIALHSLGEPSRAEELAQDVFLQLHRNLDRLTSPQHAVNWLRKVATHRAIDQSRRHPRRLEVDLERAPEPAAQTTVDDPLLRDQLRKLVASLPEKKRMIVILRYQEEMELNEIAELLDMPVRTVRTQLFRTLALLREKAARVLGEVAI